MRRGKREFPKRKSSALFRLLLTFAVIGLVTVGVTAYLAISSPALVNQFKVETHPTISVDGENYTVEITNFDYAVYLRVAVVVNWVSETSGNILAQDVAYETCYEESVFNQADWYLHSDGFYYYRHKILPEDSIKPLFDKVTPQTSEPGYELAVTLTAQTVQAVGYTDADESQSAVYNAWGVDFENLPNG